MSVPMSTAPDTAAAVPPHTVASFSDLGKFAQCRRAWWLGTYRRLRRIAEPPTGPLPFGSRIHTALEAFYDGTVADPTTAWSQLMTAEYAADETNGGWNTAALDKENKLGHRMLSGYTEWLEAEGEDAYWDTVGVEQAVTHVLDLTVDTPDGDQPVAVLVRGKLDRRLRRRSDGAVYVGDFKTMANFAETSIGALVKSPQPRIYRRLLLASGETDVRGVVYTLLRKVMRSATATPPFYKRLTIEINDADQDAYDARLEGAVTDLVRVRFALDAGADPRRAAYFTPGWWCASCPFRLPCDLMQTTPQGAEDMLSDLYTIGNPWARYMADQAGDSEVESGLGL